MSPLNLPYSHQISTGEQCRLSDRNTIDYFGIDSFTLMETAGLQASLFIGSRTDSNSTGLYFCGKGNNGGDALVIARYLAIHQNHTCHVLFPAGNDSLSADSKRNLELLLKLRSEGKSINIHESLESLDTANIPDNCYIIDGLLGTGLSTDLRPPFDTAVERINRMKGPVFAIDIPTGLHADTGMAMGAAVKADYTLSFGSLKMGFYLHQGPASAGDVKTLNLSFPEHHRGTAASLLSPDLDSILPQINRVADHKYSDRVLFAVAGSEGLTGAAMMSVLSGWKTGVGAVILITPKGLLDVYERNLPGIIKTSAGNTEDTFFRKTHAGQVLDMINSKRGTLLIGPGLGSHESTKEFAKTVLEGFTAEAVIDADALSIVADTEKPISATWILTPHPGEAVRISGSPFKNDYDRFTWMSEYSKNRSVYVVSKGNPTFIGTPAGHNYLTGYDSRMFARAGFGDILCGAIAGNLAITGSAELSSVRALLDGYIRANRLQQTIDWPLEPNDLL